VDLPIENVLTFIFPEARFMQLRRSRYINFLLSGSFFVAKIRPQPCAPFPVPFLRKVEHLVIGIWSFQVRRDGLVEQTAIGGVPDDVVFN